MQREPVFTAAWSTHDELRGKGVVGGRVVLPVARGVLHLRGFYHGVVPGRELAHEHLRQKDLPREPCERAVSINDKRTKTQKRRHRQREACRHRKTRTNRRASTQLLQTSSRWPMQETPISHKKKHTHTLMYFGVIVSIRRRLAYVTARLGRKDTSPYPPCSYTSRGETQHLLH